MSKKELLRSIEGYDEIQQELDVLRKYPLDYSTHKGRVEQILNNYHPKYLQLRISEIREETATAKTLRLISQEGYLPPFQAGQYINLFVNTCNIHTSRPYSIASSPGQTGYYDITIRQVENGFVSDYLLNEVRVGDLFKSTAPSGNFFYNPLFHGKNLVFLAGGSGITPFMSMIREVTDRGLDRNIQLIYGSRNEDDIIYKEELAERSRQHHNFTIASVISEPKSGYSGPSGFISEELIGNLLAGFAPDMYYICGPEAMYTFCLSELEKSGVLPRRIRTEVFGLPADITKHPGWPNQLIRDKTFAVSIKNKKEIKVKAGEPLLNSLEREGIVVPSCCRSGECSLCRMKLISGEVFQPFGAKVRKSDRRFGYIHSCAAYPLTDLEILL